ncbi:putative ataxin-3 homolog [Cyclospora cayetanensis]|uniref:ubiquitinyl hydrolase 1 n=1 Tax=Cyclospora cayetanensis TaxID=88456 RepID=A0A6P6RVM2_9EIME|nr:putative ataxin-3 homolog [Cyclospora cayetanensis]
MAGRQRGQLVYWEKQGADRMCALHCLNSVLQGPYFTESELSAIGLELDKKERQLMAEGGVQSEDYQAFLAEGSGNVAADGYFNVSVLIECLRRKRIHCICQKDVGEHEEPGIDFGYILNHADHWLALRRVHGMWYNLDSMKPAPTVISTFHLAAFLSSLTGQGYTVFVVRPEVGDLPAPGVMQTRSNNQFYLTQKEIDERHKQAAEQAVKDAEDAQRVASGLNNVSAQSVSSNNDVRKHLFSQSPAWEGASRLAGGAGLVSKHRFQNHTLIPLAVAPTGTEDTLEDPELQEAIRLSMECYRKEGAVVTELSLGSLDFQAQEQLMLQL